MGAMLFRVLLLTVGLAAVEIGLGGALVEGSLSAWGLVLLIGLPMIVAGSAGFMVPLFEGGHETVGPAMRNRTVLIVALGLMLVLVVSAAVSAHEGDDTAKLEVEPSEVPAGASVVLVGSALEPDSERVLVLAGGNLIVEFGTVTTDAEGMFQAELVIPGHIPAGTYELRAIGDETLTVPLGILQDGFVETSPAPSVVPAPAANETIAPNASPAANASAAPAPTVAPIDPTTAVIPRERTPLELALILGLVALSVAVGGWLIWRAERFRGPSPA